MEWPRKTCGTSSILRQALCIISNPSANSNLSYSSEMLNSGKISDFLFCVTLKFDGWPWKSIRHLFYTTLSFVHHFKAISEFKLELRVRTLSIRVKIGEFFAHVTLKFDGWPWKSIGHLFYTVETPYSMIPYTTKFHITWWTHGPQNLQRPIRILIVLLGFWIKQIFM